MVISGPARTGDIGYQMIAQPLLERLGAICAQVDVVMLWLRSPRRRRRAVPLWLEWLIACTRSRRCEWPRSMSGYSGALEGLLMVKERLECTIDESATP
jgi:hypothetical protein